jgi:hypothetical protein
VALYYLKRFGEAKTAIREAEKLGHPSASQALEVIKQQGH